MGKSHRPERLAEEIRKIVSEKLIRGDLKDPVFRNMIGISDVEVSGDGSYATLYITVLSYNPGKDTSADLKNQVIEAFNKCKGYLRSDIGKKIKVRYVPELIFKIDSSFEYGAKMDKILDSLDIKPEEAVSEEETDEFAEELD